MSTTQSSAAANGGEAKALPAVGGAAILARLRAQREAKAAAAKKSKGLTVLYASQLGTAAEIAKTIHAEAESRGIKSKVASMNEFTFEQITADNTPVVVLVSSSTGDGDCPDNAAKFYATMKRRTNATDMLKGVQYTALGLGDSNYTRYMHVPRTLKSRFQELGASMFYDAAEADEVEGIESIVDAWMEGLWSALQQVTATAVGQNGKPTAAAAATGASPAAGFISSGAPPLPACRVSLLWQSGSAAEAVRSQESSGKPTPQQLSYRDAEGRYGPDAPFWARIKAAKYLTTASSGDRKVVHLEVDIEGSGMVFVPGDSIGVMPENPDALVDGVLEKLGADGNAVFTVEPKQDKDSPTMNGASNETSTTAAADAHDANALLPHLNWPCTVRCALQKGCDLTTPPRKSLLRLLAEHCSDPAEKHNLLLLCSRDGREDYTKQILEAKPSLLDILTANPSCKPPLDALLEALPAMPPRMYSIACSSLVTSNTVHVAFTVVQYQVKGGVRGGIATTWLERLAKPVESEEDAGGVNALIPVFLRSGGSFKAPADLSAPWIMIGPGTGVAPFRGFLQHRSAQIQSLGQNGQSSGPCWLFFGCRREDQDYLYGKDWKEMVESGVLTQLHVAFSRAQEEKRYVQHIMKEKAAELRNLIVDQKGYVFVCGDGARMASDVHATLLEILKGDGQMAEAEAIQELGGMAQQGRYVRDIWS